MRNASHRIPFYLHDCPPMTLPILVDTHPASLALHAVLKPKQYHDDRYEIPPDIPKSYDGQYNPWAFGRASQISYSYAAAVLLAIDHFNDRHTAVVPELAELDDNCTVYFPEPTFADSQTDRATAVQALWNAMNPAHPFCGVLGPLQEDSTLSLLPALQALDIPLIVHSVENDWLAQSEAALLTLSASGRARAMVEYLSSREYLAQWHPRGLQDEALAEAVERIGREDFDLQTFSFVDQPPPPGVEEDEYQRQKLEELRDTGVTTIFAAIEQPYEMLGFANLLESLDMLTIEYVYILPPRVVPFDSQVLADLYGEQQPGSALDKLLAGAIVFDRLDGFDFREKDPFWQSWEQQSAAQVDRLNALVPVSWLNAEADYYQNVKPSQGTSFVYDSVIALGIGACAKQRLDLDRVVEDQEYDDG